VCYTYKHIFVSFQFTWQMLSTVPNTIYKIDSLVTLVYCFPINAVSFNHLFGSSMSPQQLKQIPI